MAKLLTVFWWIKNSFSSMVELIEYSFKNFEHTKQKLFGREKKFYTWIDVTSDMLLGNSCDFTQLCTELWCYSNWQHFYAGTFSLPARTAATALVVAHAVIILQVDKIARTRSRADWTNRSISGTVLLLSEWSTRSVTICFLKR